MFLRVLSVCLLASLLVLTVEARKPPILSDDTGCPNGSPWVNCLINPCDLEPCQTGFTCQANYCGGCFHTCKCNELTVNCFVDPCHFNPCAPGQTCVSNYCGGCNHDCYPGGGGTLETS